LMELALTDPHMTLQFGASFASVCHQSIGLLGDMGSRKRSQLLAERAARRSRERPVAVPLIATVGMAGRKPPHPSFICRSNDFDHENQASGAEKTAGARSRRGATICDTLRVEPSRELELLRLLPSVTTPADERGERVVL
jgi:hypothetical protein